MSVKYGDMSTRAFVTEYDDPGEFRWRFSHGEIGEVLEVLLADLGVGDSAPSEVELIEMLLGDDAKKISQCQSARSCVIARNYREEVEGPMERLNNIFPVRLFSTSASSSFMQHKRWSTCPQNIFC